ncbi:hypothetical protein QUG92_11630 [Curtobacterium sp. RHCKG23]|uniref:DUF3060 family protein n=1 Tax=Curtobacterium citri TaxID=3055139 RepID=A0ABT7T868_9MICO|nr:hypothetical protein [Curtobacterium citri]MDM7885756.1 hypothetical protein [Curtobacterium citri]
MSTKNTLVALSLGLALAATLTACSGAATNDKASKSTSPAPTRSPSTEYNVCKDGVARILASDLTADDEFSLDCDRVSIVGAATPGSTIELGAVSKLVVEGDGVIVHAASAKEIIVPGSRNTITHGGESTVQDIGQDNTVEQQER